MQQIISAAIWLYYGDLSWLEKTSTEVVARLSLQIALIVVVTVIPYNQARIRLNRLECSLERSKMFVRQMSHEIRNPLNVRKY
jgi:signal transduction histidine kinase